MGLQEVCIVADKVNYKTVGGTFNVRLIGMREATKDVQPRDLKPL